MIKEWRSLHGGEKQETSRTFVLEPSQGWFGFKRCPHPSSWVGLKDGSSWGRDIKTWPLTVQIDWGTMIERNIIYIPQTFCSPHWKATTNPPSGWLKPINVGWSPKFSWQLFKTSENKEQGNYIQFHEEPENSSRYILPICARRKMNEHSLRILKPKAHFHLLANAPTYGPP